MTLEEWEKEVEFVCSFFASVAAMHISVALVLLIVEQLQ